MKASAIAYAPQAFIAFHGYLDEVKKILPVDTMFFSLTNLYTTTTIEFLNNSENCIIVNGYPLNGEQRQRVLNFVLFLAKQYNLPQKFRIESKNSFPAGCGLGSSGSAFASITYAVASIVGDKSKKDKIINPTHIKRVVGKIIRRGRWSSG